MLSSVHCYHLEINWKSVVLQLLLVLLEPLVGANGVADLLKVIAVLEVFALQLLAALVVDKVDKALLGLVLIGETGIKSWRPQSLRVEVLLQAHGHS